MTRNDERRPAGNEAASQENLTRSTVAFSDATREPATPTRRPVLTSAVIRASLASSFATVVVRTDDEGRVSRRTFLTLAAAERAVKRAEAAGREAAIVLVRLEVAAVVGGETR